MEHLDQYFVMAVEMMIEVVSYFTHKPYYLHDSAGVSICNATAQVVYWRWRLWDIVWLV